MAFYSYKKVVYFFWDKPIHHFDIAAMSVFLLNGSKR